MMLSIASVTNAQKPFRLQGTAEGNPSKIYISIANNEQYGSFNPEEAIEVKNGKFSIKRDLTTITPAHISYKANSQDAITIYLVPGETLKLTVKPDEVLYDGTKIYKECSEADKAISPLLADQNAYYAKAVKLLESLPEAQVPELAQKLGDTLNIKGEEISKAIQTYLEANRKKEGAMLFLSGLIDIDSEYNAMDDIMKNGRIGQFFKHTIDLRENMLREQEEEQQREQAMLDSISGTPAPDFTLNDINGNPLSLSSLRGKYVVIDFWGSWCGWCIKGMPDMKEYYNKYKGKLEILGVDCNDSDKAWRDAVAKYELPWLHVYNPRGGEILSNYRVSGFPTKVVVTPDGKIGKIIVGEDPAFYTYLDSVLGKE